MSIPETAAGASAGPARDSLVYAIIPAYGGPALLQAALASLATEQPLLRGVIVVNNARDPAIGRVAADAGLPVIVYTPPCNLGTAGGIAAGLRQFLALPDATHAWILDDDAASTPGALSTMLAAMRMIGADAAAPLITDANGLVTWVPCRIRERPREFLRRGLTPAEFRRDCGDQPRTLDWAIWASLVLSRRAIETAGYPRLELWSQFTDIEYMLKVTARFTGILVPQAVCVHAPPESSGPSFDAKLYTAMQNGAYVTLRLPHGRRARRHLPGLILRYLQHYHWRPAAWRDALGALYEGAVLGRPSGRTRQAAQLASAEAAIGAAQPPEIARSQ